MAPRRSWGRGEYLLDLDRHGGGEVSRNWLGVEENVNAEQRVDIIKVEISSGTVPLPLDLILAWELAWRGWWGCGAACIES